MTGFGFAGAASALCAGSRGGGGVAASSRTALATGGAEAEIVGASEALATGGAIVRGRTARLAPRTPMPARTKKKASSGPTRKAPPGCGGLASAGLSLWFQDGAERGPVGSVAPAKLVATVDGPAKGLPVPTVIVRMPTSGVGSDSGALGIGKRG